MIRIVKLTFKPQYRENFMKVLDTHKDKIRSFPGCQGVDFLNDRHDPNIFFTYSHWDKPENLESYRESELFHQVWSQVKIWFADKPEAWSVDEMLL